MTSEYTSSHVIFRLASTFAFLAVFLPAMNASGQTIRVSVTPSKVTAGDTVRIMIACSDKRPLSAEILIPDKGAIPLGLTKVNSSFCESRYVVDKNAPQGLYAVHAWVGDKAKPAATGKAAFLFKKIIGDFCMIGVFDSKDLRADMDRYITEIKNFGANLLVAHTIITQRRVYYRSKICNMDSSLSIEQSYLGTLLKCADENGISVMLSVSWDMTRNIPPAQRMMSTHEIIKELYGLYGNHPSLVGFYSYQEGSGIYYAPYVRGFCNYVKKVNPGLLTACAPYMDNPLLAGYLSAIRSLDIIIYQGMVMASYRPDNRIKFPFRRVKDFGSIASGATELQNKIVLTHVEIFGYLENALKHVYIASYNNIYQQFLAAAMVPHNNGIIMFNYSGVIYNTLRRYPQYRKEFYRSRLAVFDGMKAFDLIGKASAHRDQLAVYLPWTDFQEYNWEQNYYGALDAFRTMGIPVDILPWAPIHDESYPPYYPVHANRHALMRMLQQKEVLVFPNLSGLNETDSQLIKHFLDQGGTIIAFGPRIPMGTTYDRTRIFGIEKAGRSRTHTAIVDQCSFRKRDVTGRIWELGRVTLPVWRTEGANVIATFEDGSPAITVNHYGKGKVVSVLTDAETAAREFPNLLRNALDYVGVQRYVDIIGTNQNCDVAVSKTKDGCVVGVTNHNNTKVEVLLRPIIPLSRNGTQEWIDLVAGKEFARVKDNTSVKIDVMPRSYRLVEMSEQSGR